MAATVTSGRFAAAPSRVSVVSQDVSSGGAPLTTSPTTVLPAQIDAGIHRRGLLVNWTGDQTLKLQIQYDLGVSGNGLKTIAEIDFIAGNVTPQTARFFNPNCVAGAAAGTSLISGTQPTLGTAPAVASFGFLDAPADRIALIAVAGGTTTVGALTVDLQEQM